MVPSGNLLVISPLHDEEEHVRRLVASVAAQTKPPDLWLVVDDGSRDGTRHLLAELARDVPFMQVLEAPQHAAAGHNDRLAAALEIRAFNWALGRTDPSKFEYVGKLDGDIELEPRHFARLLEEFADDPSLGIAGSMLAERPGSAWLVSVTPPNHVHGAVKLYSRGCLETIGGLHDLLGWDIADEAAARMHGFSTRSLPDLVARHHRLSGSAQGLLRGHARAGASAYIVHYPPLWIALRALKVALKRPRGLSGLAFVAGYLRAALSSTRRIEDAHLRAFVRAELVRRLRRPRDILPRGKRRLERPTRP